MITKKKILLFFLVTSLMLLVVTDSLSKRTISATDESVAKLVLKTYSSNVDICQNISNYLSDIGLDVKIETKEWSQLVGDINSRNYELMYLGIGGGITPDMSSLFSENGSLNMFGIRDIFPYCDQNEQMLIDGKTISDLGTRQQHYYDWQQLVMNNIIPMLPFYSPLSYGVTWETVRDYNASWGISDSLPYMSYSGLHEGQVDLTEWTEADMMWSELNPLFTDDSSSEHIIELLNEPLIQISPELEPKKTGIIYNWEEIDDNHYKFYLRDNLYWNPSYNITERSGVSPPLSSIPSGSLMKGLKSDEYSDGTNQQITAKDAVFTLLATANPEVGEDAGRYSWMIDCYEDSGNPLAFHILMDGNAETIENEYYADFWNCLSLSILPEFFLNSTDPTISYTTGGIMCIGLYSDIANTPQWYTFEESAFGCGKLMLDYFVKHSVTVLTKSPYWHGFGAHGLSGLSSFVDTFNIRIIPDMSAELGEFESGKLDIFNFGASFIDERKQMDIDSRFTVYNTTRNYQTFLAFNLEKALIGGYDNYIYLTEEGKTAYTKASAIRKAISYAINRSELNEIYYDGEYIISDSVIYPSMIYYYYDDIIKYPRNIDLAKEWLDAALAVPSYDLDVLNSASASRNKVVKISFPKGPGVTAVNIHYRGNLYTWQSGAMELDSENYFSFDIGGDYEKDEYVEFYFVFTDAYGDTWTSVTESFIVGQRFGETNPSPYPQTFILIIPIIAVIYKRKRMKK